MNRVISSAFIFVAGAVAGSFATWKFVETKYKKIAQEEIDSVKEAFARSENKEDNKQVEETCEEPNEDPEPRRVERERYAKTVTELGYSEEEGGATMVGGAIRIIPPYALGEEDGYEVESLNYFADGVLTDDWDNPIEDVAGFVGEDFYTYFGYHEEDAVHIRNDILKKDFEILKDERNFADIPKYHYQLVDENDA